MKRLRTIAITALTFALFMALGGTALAKDRNRDGLPDRWEKRHGLSLKVKQAKRDQDRDGLRNRAEFKSGMDPRDDDSDDDGTEDGDENAGTIESFEGGVLTIKLFGGGTVSGEVTDDTEIECDSETAGTSSRGDDDEGDRHDDEGDRHDDDEGDREHGDHDDGDDECDDDEDCGPEALTVNREVEEAELKLANGKATFTEIELD